MIGREKFEQAQEALLDFQSKHPRSREDIEEGLEQWLADARQITGVDVGAVIAGGGSLHPDHLSAAVRAFVVNSDAFAGWVAEQVDAAGLMPRKKLNAERAKLEQAVKAAETAIVRAKLEADKQAAEVKLAELD